MIHTLKNEMERMWNQFDHKAFISNDPIQIVHRLRNLSGRTTADIEVCAILTAMVSACGSGSADFPDRSASGSRA